MNECKFLPLLINLGFLYHLHFEEISLSFDEVIFFHKAIESVNKVGILYTFQ